MDIDKLTHILTRQYSYICFSTLLDIDKLTLGQAIMLIASSFSTLLDIDKLTQILLQRPRILRFSTLLDIDKLTQEIYGLLNDPVLVLCWILINLHFSAVIGAVSSGFSTLLDIDKLTLGALPFKGNSSFSTLLDIDKLTLSLNLLYMNTVLVLCWILINLHASS